MLAIRHGNIQAAVILLAHGADHKIKDAYGRTINEHCSGSNPAIAHFLQTIKQLDEQGLNIQVYFQTYPLVGLPMQSSWQAAAQQDPQTRLEKLPKKRPLQYVPEQYNTHKKAHQ